ncbi:glycine-rich domain-containing protein [Thalassobaculum litoreum]|uniref:glycine-rich domain-containing protein n=1 Tax=Thalassobaculum litoreum TaxID=420996 RepID=UPI0011141441|nr:hypothetical protein [Thalassobaculum litoreum]
MTELQLHENNKNVCNQIVLSVDLQEVKVRYLCVSKTQGGLGWSDERADVAIRNYRIWLYLVKNYLNTDLPPSKDIDEVWHCHMLNTEKYIDDCNRIFGFYLHHDPYFGLGDNADRLRVAYQSTKELFYKCFSIDIDKGHF